MLRNEKEFEKEVEKMCCEYNKEFEKQNEEQIRKDLLTKRVYYAEYNYHLNEKGQECCNCLVTTSKDEAKKLDKNYRLATIDEVEEYVSIGGIDPIPTIEVKEGIYGWFSHEYIPPLGDEELYVGYVFLQPNTEWEIRDLARCIVEIKKELQE